MSFKVPSFMSTYFSSLNAEEKKEAVVRYKSWHKHDFTQMLLGHLEDSHEKLVKEDEDKNDFISKFQFSYVAIRNKAMRKLLKELLKKLEWEV
jgi:adenosylmethionine-8-amino-7-oxononanoate aminotransferase